MAGSEKTSVLRGVLIGQDIPSDVVLRDGEVVSIEPAGAGRPDVGSAESFIGPPLFDIQVNGAFGIDLQGQGVGPSDVRALTDRLASWGVGHWVPTLITGSFEDTLHGCRVTAEAMEDPVVRRAVPGIHLEGPYISPKDGPRGAHPREQVRPPDLHEFEQWYEAAGQKILYMTVAPEVHGAIEFIRALTARGVVAALGHHAGSAEAIAAAADAGARLCTHLGNGLASMIHRHDNPLWPQLADDRLFCSLIADLEHLPAPMLKALVRAKGPERVILTSDCVHIAGLPPGRYALTGHDVELTPAGRVRLTGTDLLAGSALMLLQGVVNASRVTNLPIAEAYASATTAPAEFFGLQDYCFAPRPGAAADLIVFEVDQSSPAHWRAAIQAVYVAGKAVAECGS